MRRPFTPGDKVTNAAPSWATLILTVTSCEPQHGGYYVTAEHRMRTPDHVFEHTGYVLKGRDIVQVAMGPAADFTLYAPKPIAAPEAIPEGELVALDNSVARAERLAVLMANDGEAA